MSAEVDGVLVSLKKLCHDACRNLRYSRKDLLSPLEQLASIGDEALEQSKNHTLKSTLFERLQG